MNALRHLLLRCLQLGLLLLGCAVGNLIGAGRAQAADTVGLHLVSVHSRPGFQAANPGIYLKRDDGLTGGVLRNSYGRTSAYAGWTFETSDQRFAVTVGAITGYPARSVSLLVAPSVRVALAPGWGARLALLPKPPIPGGAAALHLSLEHAF